VVLPEKGHQVWRAAFDGVDVTWRSLHEVPPATTDFLSGYGAFFTHCGLTAVGAPGAGDDHTLHGELPAAPFTAARLICDAADGRLTLAGTYRHRATFGAAYTATASVTLLADRPQAEIAIEVVNDSARPFELMYLGHANFRLVDGATLLATAPATPAAMRVRRDVPGHVTPQPGYTDFLDQLAADPSLHQRLTPELPADPELVFEMDMEADGEGQAHAMQRHPDGSAEFVSYPRDTAPVAIRWLSRTGDHDGVGLAFPATSGVAGRTAEHARGRFVRLLAGGAWRLATTVGRLDPAGAEALARRIGAALAGISG